MKDEKRRVMEQKKYRVNERFRRTCFLMAFLLLYGLKAFGQYGGNHGDFYFSVQIPEVALLDIEPSGNNNITLELAAPSEAGSGSFRNTSANNSLWLNYTCSNSSSIFFRSYRDVNVEVSGTIPDGVQIKLQASQHSSGGRGEFGTPSSSAIILSNSPQTLISGIGGCYTGNGTGFGHQLNFTLEISDYSSFELVDNTVVQVTYTLVDSY